MYKVCNINLRHRDQVLISLEKYLKVLTHRLRVDKVILFGSFAHGDVNEASDIDLLVIADFKEDFLDRIGLLLELNRFLFPLEPLGYTPQEFDKMVAQANPFILEVLEKGKVIYDARQDKSLYC